MLSEVRLRNVMLSDYRSFIDKIGMSEEFYIYRDKLIEQRDKSQKENIEVDKRILNKISKENSGLEI